MTGRDAASSQERAETIAHAATAAAAAVEQIVRQAGAVSGAQRQHVDTATALQAARRLELAARLQTHHYIKAARADGMGWHEIGALLGLGPDAADDGLSVVEAAFNFATGRQADDTWDAAVFYWTCPACEKTIRDRGPGHGHPEDAEPGHGEGCTRLAVAVTAFDDEWTQESQYADGYAQGGEIGEALRAGGTP